jgi:hypothetical protein
VDDDLGVSPADDVFSLAPNESKLEDEFELENMPESDVAAPFLSLCVEVGGIVGVL